MRLWDMFVTIVAIRLFTFAQTDLNGQTNTIVVPKEAELGPGNSLTSPFFNFGYPSVRQVYAGTEFREIRVESILITAISFRLDDATSSIDGTVSRLRFRMSEFSGSLRDLRNGGMTENVPNATPVLDSTNFPLFASIPNSGTDFGMYIPFNIPFLYHPKRGQLIFELEFGVPSSPEVSFDAHTVSEERGLYVRWPRSDDTSSNKLIDTKFFYLIPLQVDSVRVIGDRAELDYSYSGPKSEVRVRTAQQVDGTYSIQKELEVQQLDETQWRLRFPVETNTRFFMLEHE
jgi:hypothetical protein